MFLTPQNGATTRLRFGITTNSAGGEQQITGPSALGVGVWPAQQKALGMVEADDATKAAAATRAMMFSRTNTLLSIPMLYAMIGFNGG